LRKAGPDSLREGEAAEEILAVAKTSSVDVAVTASGDGLELLSAGDPPPIVALLKDAKTEIIAAFKWDAG
jgi:hypothetical protein